MSQHKHRDKADYLKKNSVMVKREREGRARERMKAGKRKELKGGIVGEGKEEREKKDGGRNLGTKNGCDPRRKEGNEGMWKGGKAGTRKGGRTGMKEIWNERRRGGIRKERKEWEDWVKEEKA